MPVAVLFDVHGNLPALEAVVADARDAGADAFALGGDYALFGIEPIATLALLRELEPIAWVRGNGERWTAAPDEAPDDEVVQGAIGESVRSLGADAVAQLGALPFDAEAAGWRIVHASPVSDVRSFGPQDAEDDDELLDGNAAPRLLFGHTHVQFHRVRGDGLELCNPGSVGMPMDGDQRAAYALIADDGQVRLRRVAYDHPGVIALLRSRWPDEPWAQAVAGRIERAAF